MTRASVRVYPGAEGLALAGAGLFSEAYRSALTVSGRFTVLLSGGRTPLALYSLLAKDASIDWGRVHLFWGDERCVAPESPESNFKGAFDVLISRVGMPEGNVHRIEAELPPEEAAARYESALVSFFGLRPGEPPSFDLAFLGIGPDCHTLSLFPGTAALDEKKRLVASNYIERLGSSRVTLTFPALRGARLAVFLAAGREKAGALKEALSGSKACPAGLIKARKVLWLADREAASLL